MNRTNLIWRTGLLAIVAAGLASAVLAQAGTLDNTATIRIAPLSKEDVIAPKFGALVFDSDGIKQSAGEVVVSPFTLRAVVGSDKVEVSVPEFRVDQVQWEADPAGCIDDDLKTKCHPTGVPSITAMWAEISRCTWSMTTGACLLTMVSPRCSSMSPWSTTRSAASTGICKSLTVPPPTFQTTVSRSWARR
jgi:hypothetical protein